MKKIDFTQLWHSRCLRSLLVMLLALLPGVVWAQDATTMTLNGAPLNINGDEFPQKLILTGSTSDVEFVPLTISGGTEANPVEIQLQDATLTVKQDDYMSDYQRFAGIVIASNSYVKLIIDGENYVRGGRNCAGIYVPNTATLVIEAVDDNATLTSEGGCKTGGSSHGGGAGIGANVDTQYGNIIINSGIIKAYGCKGGAGIGCSWGNVGWTPGKITINGGKVTAEGSHGLSGYSCHEGLGTPYAQAEIEINGGEVNSSFAGCLNLKDGTFTSPSLTMQDGKVTITSSMTLTKDFKSSLPVTINAGVVLTVENGVKFNVGKSKVTLADGAVLNIKDHPTINDDGYYEIFTVAHLKWFRDLVNGTLTDGTAQNKSANARLMVDIDLNYEAWEPIGYIVNESESWVSYRGTFDGNYHAISNLNVEDGDYRGFFGFASGTIKNLGIINAKISGGNEVGVIAGFATGNTMQGCWTAGELDLSSSDGGNVAGITCADGSDLITNCHTSYGVLIPEGSEARISNCTAGISADAHKTGELAYLLNSKKDAGETGWGQAIGTDAHPVALEEGSNDVYKHEISKNVTTLEIRADYEYDRYTTLCFPKGVTLPENVMAFTVTGVDELSKGDFMGYVVMSKLGTNVLPANTPVILMNTGTETATISLPTVTGYYTNSETSTGIVSQDGNLLKGTYSQLTLDWRKRYDYKDCEFAHYESTLPAYQCFLEIENGKEYYRMETAELIGNIEYAVLSEEEKTCYVSRIFYAGIGTSNRKVTIPSTTQIGGEDYKVVQLGLCTDDDVDRNRFVNMNGNDNIDLYISLPKTIKTVSRQVLSQLAGNSVTRFSSDEAPEFKSSNADTYYNANIDVPYAAENVYEAAWGGQLGLRIASRKTELDIANGDIEVLMGREYFQESTSTDDSSTGSSGSSFGRIDGTLVIKGTSTTNKVWITDCPGDEPLRIAINGLNIDLSESTGATSAINVDLANVSLIVQGENTLKTSSAAKGITISDREASLSINALSTGTLDVSSGISGDNVAVAAKVYEGSSECTMQNVTASTTLNTDKNQLAFSNYDFVTGPTNLVVNGTCEKLILTDAVDVYAPSAFTAKEVTYRRGFEDNDFNSLYLPFSVNVDDFEDCEFYVINMFHQEDTDDDGVLDKMTLEVGKVPAGSTLLPNHPYLFKYKGTTLNEYVDFTLTDVDVEPTESKTFECSSMSYKYEFTGSYQSKTAEELADYYVIGIDNATQKTALVHTTTEPLQAMRWAMKMTLRDSQYGQAAANVAPSCVSIVEGGDGTITGISSVKSADDNADAYYDLNGVRKSQMTQGVNIVKTADGRVIKVVKQ